MMVRRASAGKTVVRLKGGDPFVFGRGGEEALTLARAGVAFEVVPGLTSVAAVPARAGIPLTHRDVAASFAVTTGHRAGGGDPGSPGGAHDSGGAGAWASLAGLDTLVVLMGVANLERIVRSLLEGGRSPGTPSSVVERGTLPGERIPHRPAGGHREARPEAPRLASRRARGRRRPGLAFRQGPADPRRPRPPDEHGRRT